VAIRPTASFKTPVDSSLRWCTGKIVRTYRPSNALPNTQANTIKAIPTWFTLLPSFSARKDKSGMRRGLNFSCHCPRASVLSPGRTARQPVKRADQGSSLSEVMTRLLICAGASSRRRDNPRPSITYGTGWFGIPTLVFGLICARRRLADVTHESTVPNGLSNAPDRPSFGRSRSDLKGRSGCAP